MTRYYDRTTAPLKYHTFVRYAGLPLSILMSLYKMYTSWPAEGEFNVFYLVDYGAFSLSLVLAAAAFIGFFDWKGYAWNCWMLNYIVNGLHQMIVVGLYAVYLPGEIASAIGSLIGFGFSATLIMIYYWKRRPLFFPEQNLNPYAVTAALSANNRSRSEGGSGGLTQIQYCHRCGFKLHPGSGFCSRCGAQIPKNP